jgi:hypothetical protein
MDDQLVVGDRGVAAVSGAAFGLPQLPGEQGGGLLVDVAPRVVDGQVVFDLAQLAQGGGEKSRSLKSACSRSTASTRRWTTANGEATFAVAPKGGVGMALAVTGRLKDDSLTPASEDRPVRRLQFHANDVNRRGGTRPRPVERNA